MITIFFGVVRKIILDRGEIIENFVTNNDVCLMNDRSYTYRHPATGTFSFWYLSFCHPSLRFDFDWSVDQLGGVIFLL